MKNTINSVINGHIIMKFYTRVAHDNPIPHTKSNSNICTDITMLKFEHFHGKPLNFTKRLSISVVSGSNMVKVGRVTN